MTVRSETDRKVGVVPDGGVREGVAASTTPARSIAAVPPNEDAECRYCGWSERDPTSGEHPGLLHRALLKQEAEVARLQAELEKLSIYTKGQQDRTIDQAVRAQKAENERDAAWKEMERLRVWMKRAASALGSETRAPPDRNAVLGIADGLVQRSEPPKKEAT